MLVLSRKEKERVTLHVGDVEIDIVVNSIYGNRVTLAIDAPKAVAIRRSELPPRSVLPPKPKADSTQCERLLSVLDRSLIDG